MPFETSPECQFLKIDLKDISLDANKKVRPVEKDTIFHKHKGVYKRSSLISNKHVLVFSSKEVWLVDISD